VISERELPSASASALHAALRGSLTKVAPQLAADAARAKTDDPNDAAAARHFQALLEAAYLVASADGLADAERRTLAALLEAASGQAFASDKFELHFRDLDDAVEMLGRRERLRRTAEEFETREARDEAIGFALLVAIGDGKLAAPEIAAWRELGTLLGFSEDALERRCKEIFEHLELALRSNA
jgi:tellurite resistance protein